MLSWTRAGRLEPLSPADRRFPRHRPHWMEMKIRALFLALTLVAMAVLVAGCGGGNGSVPADAVAKVGSTAITKASLDSVIAYALAISKSRGQPTPKVGTAAYTQLRGQLVTFLVKEEEFHQEGAKLGVSVSQKDV